MLRTLLAVVILAVVATWVAREVLAAFSDSQSSGGTVSMACLVEPCDTPTPTPTPTITSTPTVTPTPTKQPDPGDTDGDGCSDQRENGTDPPQGGQRDYKNPWDFFDVNGDKNIDVPNDILPVILAYLQGPLDPGGPGPNYTAAKDRGPPTAGAQYAWQRTGPDGHIDVPNDILPIILQYLHSCK